MSRSWPQGGAAVIRRLLGALAVSSWLVTAAPAGAAEVLEIQLEHLQIPINLRHLQRWSQGNSELSLEADLANGGSDQDLWLGLLNPASRRELKQLLRAPLLRDRSFGRQLLDSWAGGQLLGELGELLTTEAGKPTTGQLQASMRQLLRQQQSVSLIDLLVALPEPHLSLRLDGLLELAAQWRRQLRQQRHALVNLALMRLPPRQAEPLDEAAGPTPHLQRLSLVVPHRRNPLPVEIWASAQPGRAERPWVLLLPGLGGNADQLGWLASALAQRGWTTVALQHPGSDSAALKASLAGQRPPPGAEVLAERLADVKALLAAQRAGGLPVQGDGMVLLGHSLGGVTALMAAGLKPEPGLDRRCARAVERLPITNLSLLLQCQLPAAALPPALPRPAELRGVVLFNSFGSLLWPERGLRDLRVPALLVGGSLDLVTPPLQEQLELFLPVGHPRSRLALVQGGSHFSPLRLATGDEALF
ncbi:MAG: alpha/beta fold hydrolase, partial [Cyanobacteriota bacterium]